MNLRLAEARGQCYDGASAMAGSKSGVATQIKSLNGKCLYTHCYGHALNLAVGDAIKSVGCLEAVFDTVQEICKLIKRSPKRDTKLDELRSKSKNDPRGIHALCPTRWTVRSEALQSILQNYNERLELWDWTLQNCKDTDIKARFRGVKATMPTFDFIFGCELGVLILRQTDNLSRTLQSPKLSAAEGNAIAHDVILNPGDPSNSHFPSSPRESYRHIFLNALDATIESIRARFNEADFKCYTNLQDPLLKAVTGKQFEKELSQEASFYANDINQFQLEAELPLLAPTARAMGFDIDNFNVHDLVKMFEQLEAPRKSALSEVVLLAKILLVMPATNAVSERPFSSLKRIKTYLRSTTSNNRLNHLMILHAHKDKLDQLDLIKVANEFVDRIDSQKLVFGKFTAHDIIKKARVQHKETQTY